MIQYDWIDENKDIRMEFYPDFIDNKIVGMKMYFSYKGWAIWNEDLHSDQLIKHVDKLFMKWYGGNEFQKIVKKDYTFWVKKDSRKIIKMKTEGNRSVLVHIIDKLAKT